MPKKAKQTHSDKMLTLFQDKRFTVFFFLAIFVLLAGVFYIMQSNAAVRVNVRGCTVSGTAYRNSGGYQVDAILDTRRLGGGAVDRNGKFSFELHDLDKLSNTILVTYGTATKGGPLATITAGPCL